MKGILLLNGEPFLGEIDTRDALVYCCDGAYAWAKDRVRIDRNIGDFDSLPYLPTPPPLEIYPSEKDDTDGEIALRALLREGVDTIEIYGGGGKREDHFLGNLHLLYYACSHGVACSMRTNSATILCADGQICLSGQHGKTVSVLPFGASVYVEESWGFKYPLDGLSFVYGSCRGLSNLVINDEAWIKASGILLIIINEGAV